MEQRFETFTVLINRISRNIRKMKNQEMAEYNLRSSHISCLYYLYIHEKLTSSELCELCEEDKATISRTLEYLEEKEYLIWECKNGKRYKSAISLNENGKRIGKKIADKIDDILEEIGVVLSEEERVAFYKSLTVISEHLDEMANKNQR